MAEFWAACLVGGLLAGMLLYPAIEQLPNLGRWVRDVSVRALFGNPPRPRPRCPVYPAVGLRCARYAHDTGRHLIDPDELGALGYEQRPF